MNKTDRELVGWAIAIISNVDANDVEWPRQTEEWRNAARSWLDAVADGDAPTEEAAA